MPKIVYSSTEMKIIQHGQHHKGGAYYGANLGRVVHHFEITGSGYNYYPYNQNNYHLYNQNHHY